MEVCPVCLETCGDEQCTCGRSYHASCVNGLLKNGYECCLICYARFPPSIFLASGWYAVKEEESSINWINLAAALTTAKRSQQALQILTRARPTCPSLQTCMLIESGRAFLQLGSPCRAIRRLRLAVDCAKQASTADLYIRALAFLCTAHCEYGNHRRGRQAAAMALRHTRWMHYTIAIELMRTLARSYQATGEKCRHMEALETLCEITEWEVKDPLAKAVAQADLAIAEADLGIDSSSRLKNAMPALRKRQHAIVLTAAWSLSAQVKPSKRLRRKTHPESIE